MMISCLWLWIIMHLTVTEPSRTYATIRECYRAVESKVPSGNLETNYLYRRPERDLLIWFRD